MFLPTKINFDTTNGDKGNDYEIKSLYTIPLQVTGCTRTFAKNRCTSFLIEENKRLEKCNKV